MADKTAPTFNFHFFKRAFEEIQTRVCISNKSMNSGVAAVAYSGGLDSSVLLHLAQEYAVKHSIKLFGFHIHHGISPRADDWLDHCRLECERLGITFDSHRIDLAEKNKNGTEEAARLGRYAALGALCQRHGVPLLLTAHHQDDQAETVFLQLLRGCGVAGLCGMEVSGTAPDLLGNHDVVMARPLLDASRAELASYALSKKIVYVEDESNRDVKYTRNALRNEVLPSLTTYFYGFQQRVTRTARHAQAAQRLLNELAEQDLSLCLKDNVINLDCLRQLSRDRSENMLRYWFGQQGIRMPSTAWLSEMHKQLMEAKEDAQLCVTHPDCDIKRHRNGVYVIPRSKELLNVTPLSFRWNGEKQIFFPGFNGSLYFEEAQEGVDANWLRLQDLTLRYRQGGERLKLGHNRHTRSLKHHYQALNIPSWERESSPLVTIGGKLLFAAGIGMDCHYFSTHEGERIRFRWQPSARQFPQC